MSVAGSHRGTGARALAVSAALAAAAAAQTDAALQRVRALQAERTAMVARVALAVCAVMPLHGAGGGSGVVFDPLGFVLTNFHVVKRGRSPRPAPAADDAEAAAPLPPRDNDALEPADAEALPFALPHTPRFAAPPDTESTDPAWATMKIGLPDGELYLADVLGIDPGSDLAVLRLRPRADGAPYAWAPLGDSDALLAGEGVLAMGNPFMLATDFTPTVTWGVVSGTHRYQPGGANRFLVYPDCIQIDAPINPGNSGGPLFNERGEVVGINGRITLRDRGRVNTGVGFAIASNQIRNFLGDLMAGKHAEHGTLDLNAWFMNAPDGSERGVFVQSTFADSLPAQLGVGVGDELLRFNGTEVRSANQLATLVGVLPAGSWVSLEYRPPARDGVERAPPREVVFPLRRLDTGSSRDENRAAAPEHRRAARQALARRFAAPEQRSRGRSVVLRGPAGDTLSLAMLDGRLRLERGSTVLVGGGAADGFAVRAGVVADLSAEEAAVIDRLRTCCPLLYDGAGRQTLLAETTLEGGVHVFGAPAYRFAVAGDGEREVMLFGDGRPAGWRYRDPVLGERIEVRVDADGRRARWITETSELRDGWTVEWGPAPTADQLARPGS